MTKVYITVSLEDMANKMGPMCAKELEMILLDMVRDLHSVYDEANLN